MTRKDYVRLAAALHRAHRAVNNLEVGPMRLAARRGLNLATEEIVRELAEDNPRFNGVRFWAAVEQGVGR